MQTSTHRRARRALPVPACRMLLPLALAAACSGPGADWVEVTQLDAAAAAKQQAAERARDVLAARLLGELTAAVGEGGAVSGIRVCSERAPAIAAAVGQEHGVRLGRTSFRLRNPDNRPPDWAAAAVAAKVAEPRFYGRDGGVFAALFPIRLGPQCVTCHGLEATIQPEVRAALTTLYPDDRATGFAAGELRGWFWVEVP